MNIYTWREAKIEKKCEYYARFNNDAESEVQIACFENLGGLKTEKGIPMKRYCIYVTNTFIFRWRSGCRKHSQVREANWLYNYNTKAEANAKFSEIIKEIKNDKDLAKFEKVR